MGDDRIANLLRGLVDSLDMNVKDLVPSEEEMQMKMQAAMNAPPPPPTPDAKLKAQVESKKIDSQERIAGGKTAAKLAEHGLLKPSAALLGGLNTQPPPSNGQPNSPTA